jgi:uncharacterized protein (UPF0335 family)
MKLSDAIEQLNAVVLEIERLECEESTELGEYAELASPLKSAVDGMQAAVDRRVSLLKRLAREEEEARAVAAKFQKRAQRFAASLEQIKAATLAEIQANPQLEFRGKIHSMSVQSASKATVQFLDIAEPQKIGRIVAGDQARALYPAEWLEAVTVYSLKTGFEDALRKGELECDAAKALPKTKFLRMF